MTTRPRIGPLGAVALLILIVVLGVALLYAYRAQTIAGGPALAIALSLLPFLLLIGLVLVAAMAFARSRAGDRYARLARIADLRDRAPSRKRSSSARRAVSFASMRREYRLLDVFTDRA